MNQERSGCAPNKVFLFSGHMIDAPERQTARFPADMEPIAQRALHDLLDRLGACSEDVAICGGACGGDILFGEAALACGMRLEIYIPFDEPMFLTASVDFAGAGWHQRFVALKSHSELHVMPDERSPLPEGLNPYEQNNLRMLEAARRFGKKRIDFICLWNGQGSDGVGGTQHLMQEVDRDEGRIHWLDTTRLWNSSTVI